MAITPINISRVSTNMQSLSMLSSMQSNQLELFLQQNRLASGLRVNAPSDDPSGAAQAIEWTQALERQEQILANIRHADAFLSTTDNTVMDITAKLIDAHSIASSMANSSESADSRLAQADLIASALDSLILYGNRQFEGANLFGGQQTTNMPFTQNTGGVEYRGDEGSLFTHVGAGLDEKFNLTGADLFGALSTQLQGYVDLDPVMSLETRLADLNGTAGEGIERGFLRVQLDTPGVSFIVDLTQADNVGDVVDYMNAAAQAVGLTTGPGNQFDIAINAAGNGLDITAAGGGVTVAEVGGGYAARDLGLLGTGPGVIQGADVEPLVVGETLISSLFGGTGAALGSIQIENGPTKKIIDLSKAETIQDVLNTINSAGVNVKASINKDGTSLNVINFVSGIKMSIGEAGGNTAAMLGLLSLSGDTSLETLTGGGGFATKEGQADIRITSRSGAAIEVNLDGSTTIEDILDRINIEAMSAGVDVQATLAAYGTGIRIVDNTNGPEILRVERINGSYAIDALGLNKQADSNAATELVSDPIGGIEPDSVFSALMQLEAALRGTDDGGTGLSQEQRITAAGERINTFIERSNRVAGIVGARSAALSNRVVFTEDAVMTTEMLLSDVRDLDYTEAVTKFQQAQTTLQASLMTGSRLMELSLLNYL